MWSSVLLFRSGGHSTENDFYPTPNNVHDYKIHNIQNYKPNLQVIGHPFFQQRKTFSQLNYIRIIKSVRILCLSWFLLIGYTHFFLMNYLYLIKWHWSNYGAKKEKKNMYFVIFLYYRANNLFHFINKFSLAMFLSFSSLFF